MDPEWEPIPVLQLDWKQRRILGLYHIYNDGKGQNGHDWNSNSNQSPFAGRRKSKNEHWEEEEHHQEVEDAEPSILGGRSTQQLGHRDWKPHEWHWVENQDSNYVEQKMAKSQLKRVPQ